MEREEVNKKGREEGKKEGGRGRKINKRVEEENGRKGLIMQRRGRG